METLLPSYEIWNWIKGYEGRYEISNRGRVRSWTRCSGNTLKDGTVVKRLKFRTTPLIRAIHPNRHGYFQFGLSHAGVKLRVHREVAISFCQNPHLLPEVDHVNGKKWCNEWWNLEWVNRLESIKRAFETGLIKPAIGEDQSNTKLTNEMVLLIYRHEAKTELMAKGFGVSTHTILDIKRGRTWWHLTGHKRHIKPSEKGRFKIDPNEKYYQQYVR